MREDSICKVSHSCLLEPCCVGTILLQTVLTVTTLAAGVEGIQIETRDKISLHRDWQDLIYVEITRNSKRFNKNWTAPARLLVNASAEISSENKTE